MGLRDTFQKAGATIFAAVDDVKETAYFYNIGSTIYDASAGVASVTESRYIVSAVFLNYKKSEVDDNKIKPTDLKALMLQTDGVFEPTMNDRLKRIEAGSSVLYEVKNVEQDPVGALWTLQLRKP